MIGRLRERIAFQRPVIAGDGAGGGELAWITIDGPPGHWAWVEAVTGSEPVEAQARRPRQTWKIILRQRTGLTSDCRVLWRGLVLDIVAIMPAETRGYLTILATSGGAQ